MKLNLWFPWLIYKTLSPVPAAYNNVIIQGNIYTYFDTVSNSNFSWSYLRRYIGYSVKWYFHVNLLF